MVRDERREGEIESDGIGEHESGSIAAYAQDVLLRTTPTPPSLQLYRVTLTAALRQELPKSAKPVPLVHANDVAVAA